MVILEENQATNAQEEDVDHDDDTMALDEEVALHRMFEWSGTVDPEQRKWMDRVAAEVAVRTVTDFLVIDTPIAYNLIIGRLLIAGSWGAISLYYLAWMIPTEQGMAVALGSQSVARHTYMTSLEIVPQESVLVEEVKERGEPVDAIEVVTLEEGKVVQVSAELQEDSKKIVIAALEENKEVFAWISADIVGVSREVMEHTLDIDPEYTPVKQKKRNQGVERQQFIKSEVEKLLEFGRINEVHYP
ncbi:hypothetical protein M5689_005769 [Euphorbia peplus]|nr:hypothetical protein M5689_005769 [Euphorbia peplus]